MSRFSVRLLIALLFTIFGLVNYFGNVTENPITGEKQRLQLSPQQEVLLGLEARQELAAHYGGLYPDDELQAYVQGVGDRVVQQSVAAQSPYSFQFYLLQDRKIVNAFALPGGQIFITVALLSRMDSEAQLAGTLGHEIGHVVGRHGAEHLARQQLGLTLVQAVGIAASDSDDGARKAAAIAQAVNQLVNLKYGRDDEVESDRLGLRFMTEAGYNPIGILELMQILNSLQSGGRTLEFLSTHPDPGNRIVRLQNLIAQAFPSGLPNGLDEGKDRFTHMVYPRL